MDTYRPEVVKPCTRVGTWHPILHRCRGGCVRLFLFPNGMPAAVLGSWQRRGPAWASPLPWLSHQQELTKHKIFYHK